MRFIAKTAHFASQVKLVSKLAGAKPSALSGVLIHVGEKTPTVSTTDNETGLRLPFLASVERPGNALVPAKLLADVLAGLQEKKDDTITVELTDGQEIQLTVGSGSSQAVFRLRTLHSADFPELPAVPAGAQSIEAGELVDTYRRVKYAVSRDQTRPVLTAVNIESDGTRLTMAATDGYRLAVKPTTLKHALPEPFTVNVPGRALQELARLAKGDDRVSFGVDGKQIVFALSDGTTVNSRLIDGTFPAYRDLLANSKPAAELQLPVKPFADIVGRVSLLAQKHTPVRLEFDPKGVHVAASDVDVGDAGETLKEPYRGEPLELGVNGKFLRDGLAAVGEGTVTVGLIGPLRPLLFGASDGFSYLLMPIRLNT